MAQTTAVVGALAAGVAKAAKDVTRAHNLMPGVDLGDPQPIPSTETGRITAWAKARDAVAVIDEAGTTWVMFARMRRRVDVEDSMLVLTPASYDELSRLPHRSLAAIANAGLPNKLATLEEYPERLKAHHDARDEARRKDSQKLYTHGRRNGFLGAA